MMKSRDVLDDADAMRQPLKLAVGIATVGRPDVTLRTIQALRRQDRHPDGIVVCAPSAADAAGLELLPDATVILGPRGLPRQRNVILGTLQDYDVVVFFDDDFLPECRYLAAIEQAHRADPGLAMTTGRVLMDGILGPGLTFEQAEAALEDPHLKAVPFGLTQREVYNGYGCNMSVNLRLARKHAITFDEDLPLYAWWEDVDFSRRLARHGRIVRVDSASGVHLGIKSGRQSGVRLGYSQVANPLHLLKKGTCEADRVAAQIARNVLANFGRALWPEGYVDRRGRVVGNLRALADLVRGRLSPARILEL